MNVDVALLPRDLPAISGAGVTVVVFDVLRATTTIAAALAAGVKAIHVFGNPEAARTEAAASAGGVLLCGEEQCLPPTGFDLGNSPGAFHHGLHARRTVYMSTTNGTGAILAARGAGRVLTGAIVNAAAAARAARDAGRDVILLCAGTDGQVATEDVLGAGAVLAALRGLGPLQLSSDVAWMAERLFLAARGDLVAALRASRGGRNVLAAGLGQDVDFAARLDALDVVGQVRGDSPPVIRAAAADDANN